MYAISFDMVIANLKQHYGEPYNNAYFEIRTLLRQYGFFNIQGSVYLSDKESNMTNLVNAIIALRKIKWFKKSVRDVRGFKVEDWSDFTEIIKRDD